MCQIRGKHDIGNAFVNMSFHATALSHIVDFDQFFLFSSHLHVPVIVYI